MRQIDSFRTSSNLDVEVELLNFCCFLFNLGFGGKWGSISFPPYFCYVSLFICKFVCFKNIDFWCGRISRG
jgi:hypothetical protein